MDQPALPHGLYDDVVSHGLLARLAATPGAGDQRSPIADADAPEVLARHVSDAFRRRLESTTNPEDRALLIAQLAELLGSEDLRVDAPFQRLESVLPPLAPGVTRIDGRRPATPLSESSLLTNAPGEPGMASELRAEMASADAVDLVCAFVMWPGLHLLENEMESLAQRGVPFRIITTTYLGGTQRAALDRLIERYGAQVRVQYDAGKTRLHAKAWLFHRNTGLDTAYIGSSNLTRAALLDGIEWNVRLSRKSTPGLLEKFQATFESYWNSDGFLPYDPATDRERLDLALGKARGREDGSINVSGLDVTPWPYQAQILDALAAEREVHDRHRNLVVAATGTGKTVMAALDYRRLCEQWGRRPSLLFVAHRQEILTQSQRTYREVLRDGTFGELAVGSWQAEKWQHVFASIQGLATRGVESLPADHFDVVVVDEFHHAQASTYTKLLNHLRPKELLGLTATPERSDGSDVRVTWFGGRSAAELRLWDAINQSLLVPFHYFGVSDNTDLSTIAWSRGRYDDAELSQLYTGNQARAALILKQIQDKILDPTTMRAIGFCVSVDHAHYMASVFTEAGLPARVLSGHSSDVERRETIAALRAGTITTIFAADLLNEGVDIPEVDTVLFLRPTESSTIFLQQLGRGLRLAPGKDVLTVLDFVGHQRADFRIDKRFRALTGVPRGRLPREIEEGFPTLPSGCGIVLDSVTQKEVLDAVRARLRMQWKSIVAELRANPTDSLPEFLEETGLELSQVLSGTGRNTRTWTSLRRDAGLLDSPASDAEMLLQRRVTALAHVDDAARARAYREILADPSTAAGSPFEQMLFFSLWPNGKDAEGQKLGSMDAGWQMLAAEPAIREEMRLVVDLAFDHGRRTHKPWRPDIPLNIHANYTREEVLAGLGYASLGRLPNSFMEGVLSTDIDGTTVDAFFVTLKKSEAQFSPSTRYRDYAISPTLFHWESQNKTTTSSPTGKRYLHGDNPKLLFVREENKGELGTSPFTFLGPVRYVSHSGNAPIAITWEPETPMPADLYTTAAIAVS